MFIEDVRNYRNHIVFFKDAVEFSTPSLASQVRRPDHNPNPNPNPLSLDNPARHIDHPVLTSSPE